MTDFTGSNLPNSSNTPVGDDINEYRPPSTPANVGQSSASSIPSAPLAQPAPWTPSSVGSATPPAPVASAPAWTPPTASSPFQSVATKPAPAPANKPDAESLEAQNIFTLLGVNDGADADKEAFLDELQEVIWQDFLANDLQLLLTREELDQVKAMQAKTTDLAKQQEEIVAFLEKLIPDLEDIMLEKALELKRQMVQERVSGLREYLAGKPDQLLKLESVEQLIKQNQWAQTAQALNALQ